MKRHWHMGKKEKKKSKKSSEPRQRNRVRCLLCNKQFKELTNSHLFSKHNQMSFEEYKRKFGLLYVASPVLMKRLSQISRGEKNIWYDSKRFGPLNPMFGKSHSEIARKKISKKQMGCKRYEKWTPEVTLQTIQSLHRLNVPLTVSHFLNKYHGLYLAAIRHFDSLENAVLKAGIIPAKQSQRFKKRKKKWTKRKIIKEIIKISNAGNPLNPEWMSINHPLLYNAAQREFGGWKRARETAFALYIRLR